jgi:hypothetical protein
MQKTITVCDKCGATYSPGPTSPTVFQVTQSQRVLDLCSPACVISYIDGWLDQGMSNRRSMSNLVEPVVGEPASLSLFLCPRSNTNDSSTTL